MRPWRTPTSPWSDDRGEARLRTCLSGDVCRHRAPSTYPFPVEQLSMVGLQVSVGQAIDGLSTILSVAGYLATLSLTTGA